MSRNHAIQLKIHACKANACRVYARPGKSKRHVTQVWWETVDREGRPVAMIRLGKAVSHCDNKASADKMAKAIISQVYAQARHASHPVWTLLALHMIALGQASETACD